MRLSHLLFLAAALFALAAGLSLWNEGAPTLKLFAGMAVGTAVLFLGLQMRAKGK